MATFSPGWYPDPDNSLQKRYWDGTRWTDAIQAEVAGADVWQSKLEAQENGPPTHIRYLDEKPPSKSSSSSFGGKWIIGLVLFFLVVFGFQSCGNRSWQMGVDGNGYQVTCQDGTTSMSGGIQGACSHHGGVQ